jgi:6-phosphogluconolactonase
MAPLTAHADKKHKDGAATFVYISMAPEQKIRVFRLEPTDGKLTDVEAIPVDGTPGALAVDPERKFLFASLRSKSTLASFGIETGTGRLKLLSTAPLPEGENAVHVSTDCTGRWLLSASYAAGKVVVHRIKDDGTIQTPAVQTVETTKTAHCAVTDPDNRWVFVPHVSPNALYQFRLDAKSGKLAESGKAPGGYDKAGPRHLAFHPDAKLNMAFTSDEQGSSITAYRFNGAEGLRPVRTLSTLPADFNGQNTTAEVKIHPSGKFVWVSNRGQDSLAGFAIDPDSGKLTAQGQTPTEKTPRSFDLSPDGRFLLAAGEGSGKLAVYKVDLDTGKLTWLHADPVGKSLTWVLAVKLFAPLRYGHRVPRPPPGPFDQLPKPPSEPPPWQRELLPELRDPPPKQPPNLDPPWKRVPKEEPPASPPKWPVWLATLAVIACCWFLAICLLWTISGKSATERDSPVPVWMATSGQSEKLSGLDVLTGVITLAVVLFLGYFGYLHGGSEKDVMAWVEGPFRGFLGHHGTLLWWLILGSGLVIGIVLPVGMSVSLILHRVRYWFGRVPYWLGRRGP